MVRLEDAVIARLETQGSHFEVLVDPYLALDYKQGDDIDIEKVLAIDTIFKDSKKGDKASEENVFDLLEVDNILDAARKIIEKGEIQLTTLQRRKMMEDRKKQLINLIVRNAINPQTNTPHPPGRIEKALDEARFKIEITKTAQDHMTGAMKVLRPIIPIKIETRTIAVKMAGDFAGKAYSVIQSFGPIKKEEWLKDGSWAFLIDLPAGIVEDFFNELNSVTKGDVETKIVEKK